MVDIAQDKAKWKTVVKLGGIYEGVVVVAFNKFPLETRTSNPKIPTSKSFRLNTGLCNLQRAVISNAGHTWFYYDHLKVTSAEPAEQLRNHYIWVHKSKAAALAGSFKKRS